MAVDRITIGPPPALDRDRLVRRAKNLAWLGLGWHLVEAAIAIGAGVVAGSVALIGFGAGSLVETIAAVVLVWRFADARSISESAELRAQKLIGASFYLIALYVAVDAVRTLVAGHHPDVSYLGIALAAITAVTMPPLASAKARVAVELDSSATASEGRQNMLCAYLSVALLVGLGANAAFGAWWLDPMTALVIVGVAVKEGREAWRGDGCDCCA